MPKDAANSLRNRMRRSGHTLSGYPLWTAREDRLVIKLYPDYEALVRAFRGKRTYRALCHRACHLGIAKQKNFWTAAELCRVRRLYPKASKEEVMRNLPGRTWLQIGSLAKRHNIQRKRGYYPTGTPLLDEIRARCFELGYTMIDLDALARSKNYFTKSQWQNRLGPAEHKALIKAVYALGGSLSVEWDNY